MSLESPSNRLAIQSRAWWDGFLLVAWEMWDEWIVNKRSSSSWRLEMSQEVLSANLGNGESNSTLVFHCFDIDHSLEQFKYCRNKKQYIWKCLSISIYRSAQVGLQEIEFFVPNKTGLVQAATDHIYTYIATTHHFRSLSHQVLEFNILSPSRSSTTPIPSKLCRKQQWYVVTRARMSGSIISLRIQIHRWFADIL